MSGPDAASGTARRRRDRISWRVPFIAALLVTLGSFAALGVAIDAVAKAERERAKQDASYAAGIIAHNLAAGKTLSDTTHLFERPISWALYSRSGEIITVGRLTGGVVVLDPDNGHIPTIMSGPAEQADQQPATISEQNGSVLATRDVTAADTTYKLVVHVQTGQAANVSEQLILAAPRWIIPLALIEMLIVHVAVRGVLSSVSRIERTVRTITNAGDLVQRVPQQDRADEISELGDLVNDMLTRLQAAHDSQQQFISDASHELRSPLTSLTTALTTITRHPGEDHRALVALMESETARLNRIVTDLLTLAKPDQMTADQIDIDIDDIVLALQARVRAAGLTCQLKFQPVRTRDHLSHIDSIISNLVGNAMRHAKTQVQITLRGDDDITVVVEDDGDGVPEQQRDSVFDRFVRLDEARSRDRGGFGLGLALVKRLTEARGGHVSCDTSELGGAKFTATWPNRT